jgi:hypothetical protein
MTAATTHTRDVDASAGADELRALAAAAGHGGDLAASGYGDLLLRFLEFEADEAAAEEARR